MKFRIEKLHPVPLLDKLLLGRGWEQTSADDWRLFWGKAFPKNHQGGGFCNHSPETALLADKASLARLLNAARRHAGDPPRWQFFPRSFDLPAGRAAFETAAHAAPGQIWIAKPADGTHGDGQFLFTDSAEAPAAGDWIVQEYLSRPHLLQGRKYTLRLYVLLTSLEPLQAYFYEDGLVKRSTRPFELRAETFGDRLMHFTNSDVQRLAAGGPPPALLFSDYGRELAREGHPGGPRLRAQLREAAALTLLAAREEMLPGFRAATAAGLQSFTLFGFDFLIDADLKPWLLEVNSNPSLRVETPGDIAGSREERALKSRLLEQTLEIVGALEPLPPAAAATGPGSAHFSRLFPAPEAAAWSDDWYPRMADRDAFRAHQLPEPRSPPVRLPPGTVLLEDGLATFVAGGDQILALNETAALIAALSDEGHNRDAIATRLHQALAGPPPHRALLDEIDRVLAELRHLDCLPPARLRPPPESTMRSAETTGEIRCYAIGPWRFRIHFADPDHLLAVEDVLAHLATVDADQACFGVRVSRDADRLVVETALNRFTVPHRDTLASVVHSALLRLACRDPRTIAAFHAGAVSHGRHAVILAGKSGSGKSTLTAALVAAGGCLLSDEAAILDTDFLVQPAPVAVGLTPESLRLLDDVTAVLQPLPERRRRDDTPVHFMRPLRLAPAAVPVAGIIFPAVAPGEATRLLPLGPADALARFAASGFELPRPLEAASGAALVEWLRRTPRFELRIGSLPAAVALVQAHYGT